MQANKIVLNNEVLIDLSNDTATESDVTNGKIFHKADGSRAVGVRIFRLQEKTVTENGEVVPDEGYNGLSKVNINIPGEVIEEYDGSLVIE